MKPLLCILLALLVLLLLGKPGTAQIVNAGTIHVASGATLYSTGHVDNKSGGLLQMAGSGNPTLEIGGNYTNAPGADFQRGTGTIRMVGNGTQNVLSAGDGLHQLEVNKPSGHVVIADQTNLHGTLTLTQGNIISSTGNELLLETSASIAGGSVNSYLEGPTFVKTASTAQVVVPSGKNGEFAPCAITPQVSSACTWEVQYFNDGPPYSPGSVAGGIDHVSWKQWWNIERKAGTSPAKVRLYWNPNSDFGGITDLSELAIAHWNGSQWEPTGSSNYTYSTSGNTTSGSIVSDEFQSSFSPFTLAGLDAENPLPVELVRFDAALSPDQAAVDLSWSTLSEVNSDHFVVERTTDGRNYEFVCQVAAAGWSSAQLSYYDADRAPLTGMSYYRLKAVDRDGSYQYSGLRQVKLQQPIVAGTVLYPNPVRAGSALHVEASLAIASLRLFDGAGRLVQYVQQLPSSGTIHVGRQLPAGVYTAQLLLVDGSRLVERLVVN